MSNPLFVRHADFGDMIALLQQQQANKVDVVAPAASIRARDGMFELSGVPPVIDDRGVTDVAGLYRPTVAAESQVGTKLKIPVGFLRWLREEKRLDLYDSNVNGLLHGPHGADVAPDPEDKSFLLRLFTSGNPNRPGVLRALLSTRYGIVDNLDLLTAVMDGIRQVDVDVTIRSCDLSESSMHCKVYSPQVSALAPHFLANYRSPFTNPDLEAERQRVADDLDRWRPIAARAGMGHDLGDEPVVVAGFRFSNSETGHHAITLKPELVIQVCRNGMTLPLLAYRKNHIGEKLDTGTVTWSQDTYRKELAVITAKTRDKVSEWLSQDFLNARVDELEAQAGTPVTQPDKTIEVLAKKLGFTETERTGILSHFIAGGQLTAAGIANSVTSYSQTVPDPDRADTLDDLALHAMSLV
ncbi:hypothetical protein NONI108955_05730 [Nocardia ninae]|uniref:DUF932 domain-containing protein n=1 Tax=Nocardia ninae NBRC 108245 TaxID=1210091 RepID=A0A511MDX7_9NOCA|nr:hypothetical protein [Nocardia ninae]GEM38860.1 hypothetical protein NN4_33790 [Nocardia ninae NBRC 108245]